MTVFWDITPYILVEVYRSFRAAYCIHQQGNETYRPDNGGQKCAVVKLFGQFCACEISGSHGGDYKAFWDISKCGLVVVYRRFSTYCLHHGSEDGGN
jgi:hypothetical protein